MRQKSVLCAAVAGVLASAAVAGAAEPQAATSIDLPAQPLAEAIRTVARLNRVNVLVDPDLVKSHRAPPLKASASGSEALNQLLKGTGLTPCYVDEKTIAIVAAAAESAADACASRQHTPTASLHGVSRIAADGEFIRPELIRLAQLDTSQSAAERAPAAAAPPQATQTPSEQTQTLEEVIVTSLNFRYEEATTALKLPLSLKDTPQTVKAVTEDVIEFSGIRKFEDVYKIDASGGTSHALDDFARNYYRGFRQESDNAIKVDGFRLTGAMNLDLAPFERFEIVKGATSTLYGQNSIAGTLNAISKLPKSTFGGELSAEVGSFDHYRADVDLYGPVTADGALAFRMIGAYTDENSFLDLANRNVKLFAPALRYEFSDNTSLTARIIYQENDSRHHFGYGLMIADDGSLRIPDVPRSTYGGMEWNTVQREALFALTMLEHRFDNGWQLRGSVQYNSVDGTLAEFIPLHSFESGVSGVDALYARNDEDDVYAGEMMLFGDVELFGRRQTVFLGVDHSSQKFDHVNGLETLGGAWNVYAPDHRLIAPRRDIRDWADFAGERDRNKESGLTLQLLLRPSDALTFVLGGRYTRNDMEMRTRAGSTQFLDDTTALPFGPAEEIDTDEVTMQAGVTYALTDDINLYASYGETFEPQFGLVASGQVIEPERGNSWEAGLKGDLGNRISYSLALFDMKRTNIAQDDLVNPGFLLPLGSQRSRGVEMDLQGEIVDGWDVYASVAVLDAEFSGQFEGLRPVNAPKFGLSLFTSYEFEHGALRGFGFGGGVVHKHGRETFDDDRFGFFGAPQVFDFGDFTEVDLRLFYTRERWRFQLAATNVTNEKYYSPTFNTFAYALQVNPERAVTGHVSYRF